MSATVSDRIAEDNVAVVVVTPAVATVSVGQQQPLQAVAQRADGTAVEGAAVVWSVKDANIASVSSAGVVTALAVGATQVAASANGKSAIVAITVQKTPVASVVVRPSHVDAAVGARTPLTGLAYDAQQNLLTDRTVVWASSNATVASVDKGGVVTALAAGTATITGTAEGKSEAATITVTQAPVATVVVSPNRLSMSVGQTTRLITTARDSSGVVLTGRPVTWSSSNSAVAPISADGIVTAVAVGTTTITASSEGKTGTSAVTISNFAVGSVNVEPQTPTIVQSTSVQLSATVRDVMDAVANDRIVTWSTSDAAVATVTSAGLVTGVAPGTVTITATSEGKSATATVTVTRPPVSPVASIAVQPSAATVTTGQTATLTPVLRDAQGNALVGRAVAWSSSNAAIASVSSAGVVTGVVPGSATITATSEGKSGTAAITVTLVPVGSVTVQPPTTTVVAGQTATLTATVKDANGTVVTDRGVGWSSSNGAIATVSPTGVVTTLAAGSVTITATSESKSGTATVTATPVQTPVPVASVAVQPSSATIFTAQTTTLTATQKDAQGNVLTGRALAWSSSDATVATVSSTGVVTGVAPGSATITATSEGKSGTAVVTVTLVPVGTVTVAPSNFSVGLLQSVKLTATVKDANGVVVTNRVVSWTTSNALVATVAQDGTVTGLVMGSATITATCEGKSGTSTATVTLLLIWSPNTSNGTATIAVIN